MCADDMANSATSSIAHTEAKVTCPATKYHAASTAAHATTNTAALKMSAPFRDDLRGT